MTKKLVLDFTPEYDFLLFAIVSFEKDYKLIWDINTKLDMDFVRTEDYSVYNKKLNEDCFYSSFVYTDHDNYFDFRVISNNSEKGLFLEELKAIDYILIVNGDYNDEFKKEIQQNLQALNSIQNIFNIDPGKLKAREKLIDGLC